MVSTKKKVKRKIETYRPKNKIEKLTDRLRLRKTKKQYNNIII